MVGIFLILAAVLGGCFFYVWNRAQYGKGEATKEVYYDLKKGTNAWQIGKDLEEKELITGKIYFAFYLWKSEKLHDFKAGVYKIAPGLSIPEIARILAGGETESTQVKVTFPEGWTSKDMAKRLVANNLPGDEFLKMVENPSAEIIQKYLFLSDIPKNASLEGYLFPDTYYFAKDSTADMIINSMLKNFDQKYSESLKQQAKKQGKTTSQIVTMASIVEGEVPNDSDRKIVSGIFWKRISIGQPLQSCATLAYILGEFKPQYSIEETQTQSPYNTYQNKGLPPGPINNPGISAISASILPEQTDYLYFLSNDKKETIFSRTFEEHVANKAKYGL